MERGDSVLGIDSLVRRGSELNAAELLAHCRFSLLRLDLSNTPAVLDAFARIGPVDAVFHLGAQVAVTTSYVDRVADFQGNAQASFNVIEALKRHSPEAYCVYASTNKVFGHLQVAEPVGMKHPLDPYTPYGVSKAVGEMYFSEYGRKEMGMRTCCFRQSCIYGHHQYGVEDQGWAAWFAIASLLGRSITIYGDGRQVRDLLFIDDLIDLYLEALDRQLTGVYPVGGGPETAMSIEDGIHLIERLSGSPFPDIGRGETRPGDQPYFVADLAWTRAAGLDWKPKVMPSQGLTIMIEWIRANLPAIRQLGL